MCLRGEFFLRAIEGPLPREEGQGDKETRTGRQVEEARKHRFGIAPPRPRLGVRFSQYLLLCNMTLFIQMKNMLINTK